MKIIKKETILAFKKLVKTFDKVNTKALRQPSRSVTKCKKY